MKKMKYKNKKDVTAYHMEFKDGFYWYKDTDLSNQIASWIVEGQIKPVRDSRAKLNIYNGAKRTPKHCYVFELGETHKTAKSWKTAKIFKLY
jgi:hypothetical protein